jgi:hypothetical protein
MRQQRVETVGNRAAPSASGAVASAAFAVLASKPGNISKSILFSGIGFTLAKAGTPPAICT